MYQSSACPWLAPAVTALLTDFVVARSLRIYPSLRWQDASLLLCGYQGVSSPSPQAKTIFLSHSATCGLATRVGKILHPRPLSRRRRKAARPSRRASPSHALPSPAVFLPILQFCILPQFWPSSLDPQRQSFSLYKLKTLQYLNKNISEFLF